MNKKVSDILLNLTLVTSLTTGGLFMGATTVSSNHNTGHCGITNYIFKDEHNGNPPFSYSGNQIIDYLYVKSGQNCFQFTQDGTNGCYIVTGLGTTNVIVTGGGTGRTCQDISHVEFYAENDEPSSSPSTSPSSSPSETPSESQSPDPSSSSQPSADPSASASASPTPSATSTPSGNSDNTNSNSSSSNSSSTSSTGQVLGASTMADTGIFETILANILLALGSILSLSPLTLLKKRG